MTELRAEFSPFRCLVLLLLFALVVLQSLALREDSRHRITYKDLKNASTKEDREALLYSLTLVRVSRIDDFVEVQGSVEVQGTVDVGTVNDTVTVTIERNEY